MTEPKMPESLERQVLEEIAPVDIAELERLLAAATAGPWQERIVTRESRTFRSHSRSVEIHNGPNHVPILSGTSCEEPLTDDARLVVTLRNAAPALLAELKAAREMLGSAVSCINTIAHAVADASGYAGPRDEDAEELVEHVRRQATELKDARGEIARLTEALDVCGRAGCPVAALASRGMKHGEAT